MHHKKVSISSIFLCTFSLVEVSHVTQHKIIQLVTICINYNYFQTILLDLVANMVYRRTELIRYIHKDHFNVNLFVYI